jgi:hypothetical protein
MLGVIDGVELHSLVVTDANYRARVKLITKAQTSGSSSLTCPVVHTMFA